jgi:hypothetical protein
VAQAGDTAVDAAGLFKAMHGVPGVVSGGKLGAGDAEGLRPTVPEATATVAARAGLSRRRAEPAAAMP